MVACTLPQLIAACHVLHRLHAPRHPPCALSSLTIKFAQKQITSVVTFSSKGTNSPRTKSNFFDNHFRRYYCTANLRLLSELCTLGKRLYLITYSVFKDHKTFGVRRKFNIQIELLYLGKPQNARFECSILGDCCRRSSSLFVDATKVRMYQRPNLLSSGVRTFPTFFPDRLDSRKLVEARGLEPLTSGLQSPRSAN
jgi:hypothetical protein